MPTHEASQVPSKPVPELFDEQHQTIPDKIKVHTKPLPTTQESLAELEAGVGDAHVSDVSLDMGEVRLNEYEMKYTDFVPKLYNWAKSLGMQKGLIVPSVGFCADGNQGFASLQIFKHFGSYPFNYGYLAGVRAMEKFGPRLSEGESAVIVQAPHVGYDPKARSFGRSRRPAAHDAIGASCDVLASTIAPYVKEYEQMRKKVWLGLQGDEVQVVLSNDAIREDDGTQEGMFLRLDRILADGVERPILRQSFSRVYRASAWFTSKVRSLLEAEAGPAMAVRLPPGLLDDSLCYFKKPSLPKTESTRLHRLLIPHLPRILSTNLEPELTAALVVMQSEFDRSVRSLSEAAEYKGKRVLLVSGINVDVSPHEGEGQAFPSITFLPWAAYVQDPSGGEYVLDQSDLFDAIDSQPAENDEAIDLEASLADMVRKPRKPVTFSAKP